MFLFFYIQMLHLGAKSTGKLNCEGVSLISKSACQVNVRTDSQTKVYNTSVLNIAHGQATGTGLMPDTLLSSEVTGQLVYGDTFFQIGESQEEIYYVAEIGIRYSSKVCAVT